MNKKLVISFVLLFLLVFSVASAVFTLNVLAQSATFGGNVQERLWELRETRQDLQERRQETLERHQAVKEQVATKQAEARQRVVKRIKAVFEKILQRLNAALVRLDKIADRIASRIDKLQAKGVDTSKAEAKLLEAEKLGSQAKATIDDAQAKIAVIDPASTTVKDAVHQVVETVRSAKKALFDYHKALVAAIRELKAAANLREGTNEAE